MTHTDTQVDCTRADDLLSIIRAVLNQVSYVLNLIKLLWRQVQPNRPVLFLERKHLTISHY